MEGEYGVPLLVGHFVDHAVPSEAGVVDDDVNLAFAEFSCFGYERVDVLSVEHIAWNGDCFASCIVDLLSYGVGFGSIDVLYNDIGALLSKESCCFCTNTLT